MNKLPTNITRKTITLFLAFILTVGTITAFFPSSFTSLSMTEVYALSEYGKGDNVEYNNFNLNVNGLNVDGIPPSLMDLQSTTDKIRLK